MKGLRNWAGNYEFNATEMHTPASLAEAQELIASKPKLRVIGTRHSFNDIADTTAELVSTENLNAILSLDEEAKTITVGGGLRYGNLCRYLDERGFALHNLASLPHISIAGSAATATHGSGVGNQNLSTQIVGMKIIQADGSLKEIREGDGAFEGAVVNLGALGLVAEVTLKLVPTFEVSQEVFENLPFSELKENFDAIMSEGYSVSLFTQWFGDHVGQIWIKRAGTSGAGAKTFFGATAADGPRHPIPGTDPVNCTQQMGVLGPWYERLAHFRMDFTPSSGHELQSEFFVPRSQAYEALKAVHEMQERIAPLLFISEIRTIAKDDLWLSGSYEQDSIGIHFTWKPEWEAVRALLPDIEAALEPFAPRPHWGKLFTLAPERIRERYPRFDDFKRLVLANDPHGKFRNEYMKRLLG